MLTKQIFLNDGECRNIRTALAIAIREIQKDPKFIDWAARDSETADVVATLFYLEHHFKILEKKFITFNAESLELALTERQQNSEAPEDHKTITDISKESWKGT